jgi:hypothetical protein
MLQTTPRFELTQTGKTYYSSLWPSVWLPSIWSSDGLVFLDRFQGAYPEPSVS